MLKTLLLALTALLLLVIGYVGSLYYRVSLNPNREIEKNGEAYIAAEYAKGVAQAALEKADTYGGTTPQATWRLFVAALEAGDTDLAAKYFVVEKQEEMKVFLVREKNGGTLSYLIQDMKNIESTEFSEDKKGFDYITYPDKDLKVPSIYSLRYRENSNLWKLYEL